MPTLRIRSFVRPPAACHFATPVLDELRPKEPHDHDFVEIFWIEAGQGWHWINKGRRPLSAGSLVFIRAADRHTFASVSRTDPLRMVNIAFARRIWRTLEDRYRLMAVFDPAHPDPLEITLSKTQMAAVQSASLELRMGRLDRLAIDRFLLNLAHLIEVEADRTMPRGPAWLGKILGILSNPAHPNPPSSTRQLSLLAGRSPEHVARTFRSCLGRSPTEILNDAKLARAAAQLATTSQRILDIAIDCGLGNLSHFYQLFGDRYRTTPRRYRLDQQRIVRPPMQAMQA